MRTSSMMSLMIVVPGVRSRIPEGMAGSMPTRAPASMSCAYTSHQF